MLRRGGVGLGGCWGQLPCTQPGGGHGGTGRWARKLCGPEAHANVATCASLRVDEIAMSAPLADLSPVVELSLRLATLPHDVLAEFAAHACFTPNEQSRRDADALLAQHEEPASAKVLLSPDLLPSLLAPLAVADFAAASVCSAWRQAWTVRVRRELRAAPPLPALGFDWPDD